MALTGSVGDVQDFTYTGGMQQVVIPRDGIYLLECWGAGGGTQVNSATDRGRGGKSSGYKILRRNEVIYVCVGQVGGNAGPGGRRYNGGRDGSGASNPAEWYYRHAGGGCTHMATMTGELAALTDNRDAVLIVAGAGGSAKQWDPAHKNYSNGGDGGGLSGGMGDSYPAILAPNGGTQTGGYAFGYGQPATHDRAGGGAGWYGGYSSAVSGAGGSGYIGGVPEFAFRGVTYAPTTTAGAAGLPTSNGMARITMIAMTYLPIVFNGQEIQRVVYNGAEVEHLVIDGVEMY